MPATTVRVEQGIKADLDRLQGLFQSETGRRLSHSELLGRLLQLARRHESELMESGAGPWKPPSTQEMKRLLARVRDWGVKTDASKIDEDLYRGKDT